MCLSHIDVSLCVSSLSLPLSLRINGKISWGKYYNKIDLWRHFAINLVVLPPMPKPATQGISLHIHYLKVSEGLLQDQLFRHRGLCLDPWRYLLLNYEQGGAPVWSRLGQCRGQNSSRLYNLFL
uniref:Uncharacterized protein n=1 Tax=Pipistrellus kuhlii TaxID=59472 RepID=A0A7J7WD50_PIPKU|nr:hypothetical protein mPipKuh1_008037 [Pipistrellus kuhlii]